jgi:hypothetical protein
LFSFLFFSCLFLFVLHIFLLFIAFFRSPLISHSKVGRFYHLDKKMLSSADAKSRSMSELLAAYHLDEAICASVRALIRAEVQIRLDTLCSRVAKENNCASDRVKRVVEDMIETDDAVRRHENDHTLLEAFVY